MPTGVFPTLGFFGRTKSEGPSRFIRIFEDGSYRTVLRSAAVSGPVEIPIQNVDADERDALHAFYLAHAGAGSIAAHEFYLYDDWFADEVDPTGASTVGRRVAIFLEEKPVWSTSGPCLYSTTFRLHVLPAA